MFISNVPTLHPAQTYLSHTLPMKWLTFKELLHVNGCVLALLSLPNFWKAGITALISGGRKPRPGGSLSLALISAPHTASRFLIYNTTLGYCKVAGRQCVKCLHGPRLTLAPGTAQSSASHTAPPESFHPNRERRGRQSSLPMVQTTPTTPVWPLNISFVALILGSGLLTQCSTEGQVMGLPP